MIFLCTWRALYNIDDLFDFAPKYLQRAGLTPADMTDRTTQANSYVKYWPKKGQKL